MFYTLSAEVYRIACVIENVQQDYEPYLMDGVGSMESLEGDVYLQLVRK